MHVSSRSANLYFAAFARNLIKYSQSYFRESLNFSHITLSVLSCRIWKQLQRVQGFHRVFKVDAAPSVQIYSNFLADYSFYCGCNKTLFQEIIQIV